MVKLEMRQGNFVPSTPGANELVVKKGQSRSQAYGEQCGHSTDSVETHRKQRDAERILRNTFPKTFKSPFAADRYGEPK